MANNIIHKDNKCQTENADSFVLTPEMLNDDKYYSNICNIGLTYDGYQAELKVFLSREIRNKDGKRIKSLCILNTLATPWKIIVDSTHSAIVLPKCLAKDFFDILIADFGDKSKTYKIKFIKCSENEVNEYISPIKLEWARRVWANMYTSPKYRDGTLCTNDGQKTEIHKFALASASKVFLESFSKGGDAENGIFNLPDIDKTTIDAVLRYIYCGDKNFDPALSEKILSAAEKFQLNLLKEEAEKKLAMR